MGAFEFLAQADSFTTTTDTTAAADADAIMAALTVFSIPILLISILLIVSMWKIFTKAGKPGWAAIVPFYNTWVLAEVGGKPGWWGLVAILVNFIPLVGPIISLVLTLLIALGVGKNFGKDTVFSVLALWLFSFVGYPILGFGSAKYQPVGGGYSGYQNNGPTGTPEVFGQNSAPQQSQQPQNNNQNPPTQPPTLVQ